MGETEQVETGLRAELRAYIEEAFLYLHPELELADEDEFLAEGVIDSMGFVELVEEVQTRYRIAVDALEITEENFGSIDALVAFVERRRPS
jgi:acyl carrier protein